MSTSKPTRVPQQKGRYITLAAGNYEEVNSAQDIVSYFDIFLVAVTRGSNCFKSKGTWLDYS